jgi:transcriptional regulator with XRE-family HTH domain
MSQGGFRHVTTQADAQTAQRTAAALRLGIALRLRRLELGLSQRQVVRLLGLSAHSNLGDYERGERIPPGDIVDACEQLLAAEPGSLQILRREALCERARALCSKDLQVSQELTGGGDLLGGPDRDFPGAVNARSPVLVAGSPPAKARPDGSSQD